MEAITPFLQAIVGFMLGAFTVSRVGHWIVGIVATAKARREDPSKVGYAALASSVLAAAGPWLLAVLGTVAVKSFGQPWLSWVAGGFGFSLLYVGAVTFVVARKL
jgi:type IV secretory pathway TrbD component